MESELAGKHRTGTLYTFLVSVCLDKFILHFVASSCISCRHDDDLYKTVILDYEEKHKELLAENYELRQCLKNLQKEMTNATSQTNLDNSLSLVRLVYIHSFFIFILQKQTKQ